jgi:hypothetical protein
VTRGRDFNPGHGKFPGYISDQAYASNLHQIRLEEKLPALSFD